MKKLTQNSIIAALVFILFVGVFAFFAWATEWFTSTKKLREIFGGDSHAASASIGVEPVKTSALRSSTTGSLNFDSDDATITVGTVSFTKPSYYIDANYDFVMYTDGYWGEKLSFNLCDVSGESVYEKVFTYSSVNLKNTADSSSKRSEEFRISFNDILATVTEKIYEGAGINIRLINLASSSIFSSAPVEVFYYTPGTLITYTEVDTKITFPSFKCQGYKANYGINFSWNSASDEYSLTFHFNCLNDMPLYHSIVSLTLNGNDVKDFDRETAKSCLTRNGDESFTLDLAKLFFLNDMPELITLKISAGSSPCGNTGCIYISAPDFEEGGVYAQTFERRYIVSKLPAPTNIRYENLSLLWDAVDGAKGYSVSAGATLFGTVNEPTFDLSNFHLEDGDHTFRIRALGNVGAALASDPATARLVTAYNSSLNLERAVALTYYINDDPYTVFVPVNGSVVSNLYDPGTPERPFDGWYYDAAFTQPVHGEDTITKDTSVYAKFKESTPPPAADSGDGDKVDNKAPTETGDQSFWAKNKWIIMWVGIGVAVVAAVSAVIVLWWKKR